MPKKLSTKLRTPLASSATPIATTANITDLFASETLEASPPEVRYLNADKRSITTAKIIKIAKSQLTAVSKMPKKVPTFKVTLGGGGKGAALAIIGKSMLPKKNIFEILFNFIKNLSKLRPFHNYVLTMKTKYPIK